MNEAQGIEVRIRWTCPICGRTKNRLALVAETRRRFIGESGSKGPYR